MNSYMTDRFLYKYRSVEHIKRDLDGLKNNYFWASDIEHLNDDKEGCFNSNIESQLSQLERLMKMSSSTQSFKKNIKIQYQSIIDKIKHVGVFSLSLSPCIGPMWSNYASERKGYCIQYSQEKLLYPIGNVCLYDRNVLDVQYEDVIPQINLNDIHNVLLLKKMIGTKAESWSSEQEVRLVTDTPYKQKYVPSALFGIIFGSEMDEANKQLIKDALKGRNVTFFCLKSDKATYDYEIEKQEEYKVSTDLDESGYSFINKFAPTTDNFYVKLNFDVKSKEDILHFIQEFQRIHTDGGRQCNIFVHDKYVDKDKFKDTYNNYDYLHEHEIAELSIGMDSVYFNPDYKLLQEN